MGGQKIAKPPVILPLSVNINSESLQFWTSSTSLSKGWETWIKLSDNVAFDKQSCRWWNRMSLFCMKLDFSTFFTDFSRRRFRCIIASILKKKHYNVFCFSFREIWFPIGHALYLHQYQKILPALFLWDFGGNNGFTLKNSGGQP